VGPATSLPCLMVSSKTRLLAEELTVDGIAAAATALIMAGASTFAVIAPGDPRRSGCFGSNSSHNAAINATPPIRNAIGLVLIDTYAGDTATWTPPGWQDRPHGLSGPYRYPPARV